MAQVGACVHVGPHQRGRQRHRRGDLSASGGAGRGGRSVLRTFGLGRQATAAAFETVGSHDLLDHADSEAFLEAAELTPISSAFVHRAVLVRQADILGVLLDGSLEEALAALAGADTVVLAGRVIPADGAE